MSTFIVRARSDGRGGIKPFNTYTSAQAGAYVTIGDTRIKVTSDGRMNIPKSIMDKYGITGDDGRKRVGITFTTGGGKNAWKDVKAMVLKPLEKDRDGRQGTTIKKAGSQGGVLKPSDGSDYTWSN